MKETNGDLQKVLRIQIFNGELGQKVSDNTSPLKDYKKDLKALSIPGYGGEQVYQLLKTGSCEFIFEHFRISMQVFDMTKDQMKQFSQKP